MSPIDKASDLAFSIQNRCLHLKVKQVSHFKVNNCLHLNSRVHLKVNRCLHLKVMMSQEGCHIRNFPFSNFREFCVTFTVTPICLKVQAPIYLEV